VSIVDVRSPPITTLARGRFISAPVEVEKAIGMKLKLAPKAAMSTGLSLRRAPPNMASCHECPAFRI
jgi:hypothetical protein